MKTSQFEGVKVAIKQDKTGYVLTLSIHPDEIPDEVLRDFVGSRYQVVMVRLNTDEGSKTYPVTMFVLLECFAAIQHFTSFSMMAVKSS